MNELTKIESWPVTKKDQTEYADAVINQILSGEVDPVKVDLIMKSMEEVLKKIRTHEGVKACVIDEAEKYGKTFDLHGATVTVSKRTVKDFSGVDSVLDELYQQAESLKASIKAREATVESGSDPATGETFSPPKTSTTTFLTYKFK